MESVIPVKKKTSRFIPDNRPTCRDTTTDRQCRPIASCGSVGSGDRQASYGKEHIGAVQIGSGPVAPHSSS
jgi:hypothetical protein